MEQIATFHPEKSKTPRLVEFILRTPGQQLLHLHSNAYLLSWHIMLMCKRVCSSEWERRTDLEQISVSYIPPREVKDSMLLCVHSTNSRAAASLLTFQDQWRVCGKGQRSLRMGVPTQSKALPGPT